MSNTGAAVSDKIEEDQVEDQESASLLEFRDVKKVYPARGFDGRGRGVRAVDGVSFNIGLREVLGLVGESGSGKSTVGRLAAKLEEPSAGQILFRGDDIGLLRGRALHRFRRKVQVIFQDPYGSLDPRLSIGRSIEEPLLVHGEPASKAKKRGIELLDVVGLREEFWHRYPHQLSGGQRQRVAIARALVLGPDLLVCDEPVSALDVSIQAQILNLLRDMRESLGLTYLFIGHDLSVMYYMTDRIAVQYCGRIVEFGRTETLYSNARHPYTQALLSAAPTLQADTVVSRPAGAGSTLNLQRAPTGCSFRLRCPFAQEICAESDPELAESANNHWIACHFHTSIPVFSPQESGAQVVSRQSKLYQRATSGE